MSQSSAEAVDRTDAPLNRRLIIGIAAGQFGTAINTVSLVLVAWPLAAAAISPSSKQWVLGLLAGVHAFVLMVVAPTCGVLSDRCTSPFGMRRPFILAGAALGTVAMFVMGMATELPGLIIGDVMHAMGTGIFVGGFAAVVPDHIPASYRGRVLGVVAAMTILAGVVASIALPRMTDQWLMFAVPGVIGGICSLGLAAILPDRRLGATPKGDEALALLPGFVDRFRVSPRLAPDFSWAWLTKFLMTLASAFTTTYGIYFLTDQIAVPAADLSGLITATGLIGLLTAVVGAGVGSWVSDRFQIRKTLILFSSLVIAAGATIIAFAPGTGTYLVGMAVAGLATGILMPVEGALIIDVLPGEGRESGKYMAVAGLADSIPRSIGPMLAPAVIAIGGLTALGGYPVLYLVGAALAAIAALLIPLIKGSC
ncbi:MFS transporter [Mycolicibacterium helvum]|uniref:MFS transporter n=1 Tax=Mycolicibacterium helvum TaxID=1534349 RepID=A0A7I7T6C5_9MYCO|nr:MFS transporter [Mycolicibacterium helvum]BBY64029.1 MFS transporter [Mycolicibacterium helvum]